MGLPNWIVGFVKKPSDWVEAGFAVYKLLFTIGAAALVVKFWKKPVR